MREGPQREPTGSLRAGLAVVRAAVSGCALLALTFLHGQPARADDPPAPPAPDAPADPAAPPKPAGAAAPAAPTDVRRVRPGNALLPEHAFLLPFGARGRDRPDAEKPRDLVLGALSWLAANQSADGHWIGGPTAAPRPDTDVGVTGLALLAFLSAGYGPDAGDVYAATVAKGLAYLRAAQDGDGCIGMRGYMHFVYGHAFATQALLEAAAWTGDADTHAAAQRALQFAYLARNPRFGWRYGVRPGESDTSITGSMWGAHHLATEVGAAAARVGLAPPFRTDPATDEGVGAWMRRVTDATGQAGYQSRGTGSARTVELVERFPGEMTEAVAAIAAWFRLARGVEPDLAARGLGLVAKLPPLWDLKSGRIDFYYWYYGALAMRLAPPALSKPWFAALETAARAGAEGTGAQVRWGVVDAWSNEGGPVYATAMMTLALEGNWRFSPPADASDVLALAQREDVAPALRARALRSLALRRHPRLSDVAQRGLAATSPIVRRAAAEAIAAVDGKDLPMPVLVATSRDADAAVAAPVVRALGVRGKSALAALLAATGHVGPSVRAAAYDALGGLGKDAAGEAEAFARGRADADVTVALAAAEAGWSATADAAGALPVLKEALRAADAPARARAIETATRLGPEALALETDLAARLTDASETLRVDAAAALAALHPDATPEVGPFVTALARADPLVRERAALRLGEMGARAAAATAALANALRTDPDAVVRGTAARALGRVGREARDAVPALEDAALDDDRDVVEAAGASLALVEGGETATSERGKPTAPVPADVRELRAVLASPGATSLARRGVVAAGSTTAPWLSSLLVDADANVRARAAELLGEIGSSARTQVPALAVAASKGDPGVRAAAVRALGRLAPTSSETLAACVEAAEADDARLRSAAMSVLGSSAKPTVHAIDACLVALRRRDGGRAARALGALARWKVSVADALAEAIVGVATQPGPPALRVLAVAALGAGLNGISPSLPALLDLAAAADVDELRGHALDAVAAVAARDAAAGGAAVVRWLGAKPNARAGYEEVVRATGAAAGPALAAALEDPDLDTARATATLLASVPEALVAHAVAVCQRATGARLGIAGILGHGFAEAPEGVAAILGCIKHSKAPIRQGAANVAGGMGGAPSADRDRLIAALTSASGRERNASVKVAFANALFALKPK